MLDKLAAATQGQSRPQIGQQLCSDTLPIDPETSGLFQCSCVMQAFAAAVEQQLLRQSAALQQLPEAIKARRQAEQWSAPTPDTKPGTKSIAMTVLEVVLHTQQLQVWTRSRRALMYSCKRKAIMLPMA